MNIKSLEQIKKQTCSKYDIYKKFWISCQRLKLLTYSLTTVSKFSAIYHHVVSKWHPNSIEQKWKIEVAKLTTYYSKTWSGFWGLFSWSREKFRWLCTFSQLQFCKASSLTMEWIWACRTSGRGWAFVHYLMKTKYLWTLFWPPAQPGHS